MFKNNQPDYYNDAVRNARVNTDNEEYQSDSKGKLLLISNLILISVVLGYFIYQDMQKKPKTEVMGVNYTVNIHEEKNKEVMVPPEKKELIVTRKESSIEKESNSKENVNYIQALNSELSEIDSKKNTTPQENSEPSSENKKLEKILNTINTEDFSQSTNVVKIENEPKIDEELDINKLANLIDSLIIDGE